MGRYTMRRVAKAVDQKNTQYKIGKEHPHSFESTGYRFL